jgi:hypothetical protein
MWLPLRVEWHTKPASSLKQLEMVVAMFGLKHVVDDEDYLFTLNDEGEIEVEDWLGMSLLLSGQYVY